VQQPLNDEVCTHTLDFSHSLMCGHVHMRTVKHTGYAGRWCLAGANGFVQWMLQRFDIAAEFVERKKYTTTETRAHCTEWLLCSGVCCFVYRRFHIQ
jgi:hypothetical protein